MNTPTSPESPTEPAGPRVNWNTSQLKSSYVNFANANSTQEEVVLNFGMNNNWDRMASPLVREEFGVWSLFLPDEKYAATLTHGSLVKVNVVWYC